MNQEHILYVVIGQAALVIGFLLKTLWSGSKSEMNELKEALKENSGVTVKNTLASEILTIRVTSLESKFDEVGELRRDVQNIGATVRAMKPRKDS